MNSEKWADWLRIGALLSVICLVTITATLISSAGVKAPLLTMMGSAAIIMVLFSVSRNAITVQNVGTILGTAIVMVGGGYWLIDATQHGTVDDKALSTTLTAWLTLSLVVYGILMLIPAVYNFIVEFRSR